MNLQHSLLAAVAHLTLAIAPAWSNAEPAGPSAAVESPEPTVAEVAGESASNRPRSGWKSPWFEGGTGSWLADRFGRQNSVALTSEETPLATPRLGPLNEQVELVEPAEMYDGPIVDLTDDDGGIYAPMRSYGGQAYDLHLMPQGLIYRTYMAGAKESRFRTVWHNADGHSIWDITLGGNVGLLRYGTRGDERPEGIQLGIEGAGLVRLDRDSYNDVAATDYRFGIPLTWGDSIYQVKFAYYHLSSHVGDEFLINNVGFNRLNYSRDVFVWGHSLYPSDSVRLYTEIGYAFYNDVSDPWEFQFGVDYGPNGRTGARGAPFAAFNGHLREEVDFGGNFVAQAGWAWRRSPATGIYRVGVEYYNGKDDQFSFFNDSVEKIGLGMWYDY